MKNIALASGIGHISVTAQERWLSGLRRTPGKREYLNSTVGSNPSLSATPIFGHSQYFKASSSPPAQLHTARARKNLWGMFVAWESV